MTVSVTVDDEVLRWAPEWTKQVETSDLTTAGWEVTIPQPGALPGSQMSIRKQFKTADQLAAVLTEIDGPDGIFGDTSLLVTHEDATTNYDLSLMVNTSRSVADLIDPAAATLFGGNLFGGNLFGGNLFGVPAEELVDRAGTDLNDAVSLVVRVTVPQGSARLPKSGAFSLNEGGTKLLHLTSEYLDVELAEAIDTAEQTRSDARSLTLLVAFWWVVLAAVAVAIVVVVARAVQRRNDRARGLPRKVWM